MNAMRVASATELLQASSEDQAALRFELSDAIFGFHAQQAIEKLYKALIAASGRSYPFNHDLVVLASLVTAAGFTLPTFQFHLQDLAEYVGEFRYVAPLPFTGAQREMLRQDVETLRVFSLNRVEELQVST